MIRNEFLGTTVLQRICRLRKMGDLVERHTSGAKALLRCDFVWHG
jgi:hypothetical protein